MATKVWVGGVAPDTQERVSDDGSGRHGRPHHAAPGPLCSFKAPPGRAPRCLRAPGGRAAFRHWSLILLPHALQELEDEASLPFRGRPMASLAECRS